jgi:cytosine/uracil/thiamine/allantoin permease
MDTGHSSVSNLCLPPTTSIYTSAINSAHTIPVRSLAASTLATFMANIGGIATHMFSQSDYTRYARKPGDQVLA